MSREQMMQVSVSVEMDRGFPSPLIARAVGDAMQAFWAEAPECQAVVYGYGSDGEPLDEAVEYAPIFVTIERNDAA